MGTDEEVKKMVEDYIIGLVAYSKMQAYRKLSHDTSA
jgi:hypothetical protein